MCLCQKRAVESAHMHVCVDVGMCTCYKKERIQQKGKNINILVFFIHLF